MRLRPKMTAGVMFTGILAHMALCSCVPTEPPEGIERHACYPNRTCNAGLACLSDLCVRLPGHGDANDGGAEDAWSVGAPVARSLGE
jgi:hypothetical protein